MDKLLTLLNDRQVLRSADARAAGISGRDVLKAEAAGHLFRYRGLFVTPEAYADQRLDDAVLCDLSGGVIGLLSAGVRHGLVDAVPAATDVIVPWAARQATKTMPVRTFRTRVPEALTVGVEAEVFHGLEIRITDPARTVVDLHRVQPDAHRQHAVTALARYVGEGHPVDELHRIATTFGTWDALRPEVEIALESRGGMKP